MSDRDAHAPCAPSSAHIWAPVDGCRASVALQAAYPGPDDTPEAREGTAAHYYVTEILCGRDVPLGSLAPNGHPIDAEMIDCAQGLLIDVRDTMRLNPGGVLRVEQRVRMHALVHPGNDGTPDVVYILPAQRLAFIWDYKYGHRFVDAVGCWQLADYAVGVIEGEGGDFTGWRLHLSIAQPRNYHPVGPIREWAITGEKLREYAGQMRVAAAEAMAPNARYQTGAHCRDCSGRYPCPALQRAGALAMDVSLQGSPVEMPPHAVGLELRQIDDAIRRLEARRTGLEEHALGLIRGGTVVPFYSGEHASGQERWNLPVPQITALGEMFGVDLRKPAVLTPAQARKAGMPPAALDGLTERPRGAVKLVRVSDNDAKLAFE